MELNEKIDDGNIIYNNECNNSTEQCCILDNIKFHAVDSAFKGIVLTPICEIQHSKADYLTICQIIPLKEVFEDYLIDKGLKPIEIVGLETITKSKYGNTYNEFSDKYLRNQVIRFYFLPENNDKFKDSLIDFNLVESILIKDFDKYKKICEIKSPWKEDIIASYASYCV
ncbi:MAG: hypothetical protein ACYDIA_21780, partial [Candidatus Humimicrobiaceae bacterium]